MFNDEFVTRKKPINEQSRKKFADRILGKLDELKRDLEQKRSKHDQLITDLDSIQKTMLNLDSEIEGIEKWYQEILAIDFNAKEPEPETKDEEPTKEDDKSDAELVEEELAKEGLTLADVLKELQKKNAK